VPNDPQSPFVTSGIRVGSPAITTRGFNEADSVELTNWMCDIMDALAKDADDTSVIDATRDKVSEICARLPVYK